METNVDFYWYSQYYFALFLINVHLKLNRVFKDKLHNFKVKNKK